MKLESVAQQYRLASVRLHCWSAFCDAVWLQDWPPLWLHDGSLRSLRLEASLCMSSRKDSPVSLLLENQSLALPEIYSHVFLSQTGTGPSPKTCLGTWGLTVLPNSDQSVPHSGPRESVSPKLLCLEIQRTV